MRETKQIRRIRDMEAKMDEAKAVLERFSAAFQDYVQIQDEMAELEDYYAGDWMKDYEADEAGSEAGRSIRGRAVRSAGGNPSGGLRRALRLRTADEPGSALRERNT